MKANTVKLPSNHSHQMAKVIKFEDFLHLANFYYRSVGIDLWCSSGGFLLQFNFYLLIVNITLVSITEMTFVIMSFKENFVEATMTLSYIGFNIVGTIKIYYMWRKKVELAQFLTSMKDIFPNTNQKQEKMEVRRHLRQSTIIMAALTLIFMILIWTYNLYPLVHHQIYDRWLNARTIKKELPYKCYIPWEWRDNWSYYFLYISQVLAGWHMACGQIASDLLIYAMATQMVMHYEHVARIIIEYQPKMSLRRRTKEPVSNERNLKELRSQAHAEWIAYYEDLKFLGELVAYHSKILSLSDVMNDTFGVALLVNFMTSSFVICFVGFQMTMDIQFKLLMFLFASLAQVYWISHYGQLLIDASVNVADAVFSHDWPDSHIHYQRMLVVVMARAQKPAMLTATSFVLISRGTMTDIIQISYKFFALLRTMYNN